jgi:hypothetical protein
MIADRSGWAVGLQASTRGLAACPVGTRPGGCRILDDYLQQVPDPSSPVV